MGRRWILFSWRSGVTVFGFFARSLIFISRLWNLLSTLGCYEAILFVSERVNNALKEMREVVVLQLFAFEVAFVSCIESFHFRPPVDIICSFSWLSQTDSDWLQPGIMFDQAWFFFDFFNLCWIFCLAAIIWDSRFVLPFDQALMLVTSFVTMMDRRKFFVRYLSVRHNRRD